MYLIGAYFYVKMSDNGLQIVMFTHVLFHEAPLVAAKVPRTVRLLNVVKNPRL